MSVRRQSISVKTVLLILTLFVIASSSVIIILVSSEKSAYKVWLNLDVRGVASGDTAWVEPSIIEARSLGTWTFSYVPGSDFSTVGRLLLLIPSGFMPGSKSWTPPQATNSEFPGYLMVKSSNTASEFKVTVISDAYDYRVILDFDKNPPSGGDTLRIFYGGDNDSKSAMTWSHVRAGNHRFPILTDKKGDRLFLEVHPSPVVKVKARYAKRFLTVVPSLLSSDEFNRVRIVSLDEFNNLDTEYRGLLNLSCVDDTPCGIPAKAELAKEDSGIIEVEMKASVGIHQIEVISNNGVHGISNPYKVESKSPEFSLYWGDLQNHSDLSDGSGSVKEFYEYARDISSLDFVALTDHDHINFTDYLRPEIWSEVKSSVDKYNMKEDFVTFLGWEWTQDDGGHKHIIYKNNEGTPLPFTDYPNPEDLWLALDGEPALTIPHHVAWGARKVDWNYRNDNYQRVVEIYSQHAANEYYLNPLDHSNEKDRAKGHYVRDALSKGHKLGIISSGDGHFGFPGNGWMGGLTALDSASRGTGLVGVYAKNLTREDIFEAIYSRRVFGTTDHRTIIEFKVDDRWMGSEIESYEFPTISGAVYSHTPVNRVELVKFDGREYTVTPMVPLPEYKNFEFSIIDTLFVRSSFYYLRVISKGNENDRFAWSSPVWVSKPPKEDILNLPAEKSAGNFRDANYSRTNEVFYSVEVNFPAFTKSIELCYQTYDIDSSDEMNLFVNGILIKNLVMTNENEWGQPTSVLIPRHLVENMNLIQFALDEPGEVSSDGIWGIKNVTFQVERE